MAGKGICFRFRISSSRNLPSLCLERLVTATQRNQPSFGAGDEHAELDGRGSDLAISLETVVNSKQPRTCTSPLAAINSLLRYRPTPATTRTPIISISHDHITCPSSLSRSPPISPSPSRSLGPVRVGHLPPGLHSRFIFEFVDRLRGARSQKEADITSAPGKRGGFLTAGIVYVRKVVLCTAV